MAKQHGITVRPQSKAHLTNNDPGRDLARGFGRFGGGAFRGGSLFRFPGGGGGAGILGGGGGVQSLFRVNVRFFYDRAAVQQALVTMHHQGLIRAAGRVRDHARRSIIQVGRARPMLRIMTLNPGVPLRGLLNMPMLPRTRNALVTRIAEIDFGRNLSSPPGTPPYTHVPFSNMVGFRRNLQYGYDPGTHTGLAGPDRRGGQWDLPALHEFGGRLQMRRYVWQPRYAITATYTPIVRWFRNGFAPRRGRWVPTMLTRRFPFPPRPFMSRAMRTAIAAGEVQAGFAGTFGTRVVR
jgi:hypothetical protein